MKRSDGAIVTRDEMEEMIIRRDIQIDNLLQRIDVLERAFETESSHIVLESDLDEYAEGLPV